MQVPRYIYFSIFLLGTLSGIYFGNISLFSGLSLVCVLGVHMCLLIQVLLFEKRFLFGSCLFVGAFLGAYIYAVSIGYVAHQTLQTLAPYENQLSIYRSEVHNIYKREAYEDVYTMNLYSIDDQEFLGIQHLLYVPKNYSLSPGEEVEFLGKMRFFKDFQSFSYKEYMLSSGLYFSLRTMSITQIKDFESIEKSIFHIRQNLITRIYKLFPREEALFLAGILIGAREDIPKDIEEDFNRSGLTHFIAVSGFNISLCVIFIVFLTQYFPFWLRMVSVSMSIMFFTVFVGATAPVVRAAIMGIIAYYFLHTGYKIKHITLLLFTAVCMVLYSPLSLNYDVSMHLSFLAVLGILYTQGFFTRVFSFIPQVFALREALVLTCAAFVFTFPIMMFQFGQISVVAPITNVLVAWTIPLAMLLGACTLILDMFWSFGAGIFAYITWLILHYDIVIVRSFGDMKWAALEQDIGIYKNYGMVLYFIIFGYILSYFYLKKK